MRGRSDAPKVETPVVRIPNKRHGVSIISSLANKGQIRWRIFHVALNSTILIDCFKRLIKGQKKKVFLMLQSKAVKACLARHIDQIEVFLIGLYLPSYSP